MTKYDALDKVGVFMANFRSKSERESAQRTRAIEIYQFALDRSEAFFCKDLADRGSVSIERRALALLEEQGLLRAHRSPLGSSYSVARVVAPATCLDHVKEVPHSRGLTIYRVSPSIAATHATDEFLQLYAIDGVRYV